MSHPRSAIAFRLKADSLLLEDQMEIIAVHPDTLRQIDRWRHCEAIGHAAAWNLARQARSAAPTWFTRQQCRILCQVGRTLIELGHWLQRRAVAPTV